MALITDDDDIVIDETKIIEPDESEELDDEFIDEVVEEEVASDTNEMTIVGESIVEDEEFDEDRDDIYEPYEEDHSLLDEEDDQ